MDARISTSSHPDVVMIESTPRPTASPARVSFGQVIAAGANGIVQGAELVASKLPGSPLSAAAVRGGAAATATPIADFDGLSANSSAEGPAPATTSGSTSAAGIGGVTVGGVTVGGSAASTASSTDSTSSIDASLQQSAQMNLYYLQIQQEVDSQNRTFTTLSNVLKTEHDSAKAAIENVHS